MPLVHRNQVPEVHYTLCRFSVYQFETPFKARCPPILYSFFASVFIPYFISLFAFVMSIALSVCFYIHPSFSKSSHCLNRSLVVSIQLFINQARNNRRPLFNSILSIFDLSARIFYNCVVNQCREQACFYLIVMDGGYGGIYDRFDDQTLHFSYY